MLSASKRSRSDNAGLWFSRLPDVEESPFNVYLPYSNLKVKFAGSFVNDYSKPVAGLRIR